MFDGLKAPIQIEYPILKSLHQECFGFRSLKYFHVSMYLLAFYNLTQT